jgi:hypothetical protein
MKVSETPENYVWLAFNLLVDKGSLKLSRRGKGI